MTSSPSPAEVLSVVGLGKSYRRRAVLSGVNLSVRGGQALAVIGPNGAGKSTFLGCVTGERLPSAGTVRICGADPFSDPREVARHLGFVPEQPFLYPELTVGEVLRFVAEVRGLPSGDGDKERDRLLALFGLVGVDGVLCRELSQGMGRKVAIITALLHQPRLLVLDEVFNGLDQNSVDAFIAELDERRRSGAAVLLSSHDLPLLARWCDSGLLLAPAGYEVIEGADWRRWSSAPALPGSTTSGWLSGS